MKFPNLLKAAKSTQIDALIEGLVVNANGYFLTEEQLVAIEESLTTNAAAVETAATTARAENATALQAAEANLVTANATIATHTATIAARDARITALEAEGGELRQTARANDETPKVKFHESDKDPANVLADSLFGKPAESK